MTGRPPESTDSALTYKVCGDVLILAVIVIDLELVFGFVTSECITVSTSHTDIALGKEGKYFHGGRRGKQAYTHGLG